MIRIYHDSHNLFYRDPFGAARCLDRVTLRLSLAGAGIPKGIFLQYRLDSGGDTVIAPMRYIYNVGDSSVYEAGITLPAEPDLLWYWFHVALDQSEFFYGNNAALLGGVGEIGRNPYQITVYDAAYRTPDWLKNGVIYHIFVDRFSDGGQPLLHRRNDIIVKKWGETPLYMAEQYGGVYLSNDFFGGNLPGIIKNIPYFRDLGVSILYLSPIFKAYSNHKYDTGDYEQIDPTFGDAETFIALCREAAAAGIRVILDGVFNHTGSDSRYFNKNGNYPELGAYQSKQSKYYDWYSFDEYPDKYKSWWDFPTLPTLNINNEDVQGYIADSDGSVVKKYLRLGASGWRLDVVDELPGFFVENLRTAVKKEKPNAALLGEVWEDASSKISYGVRRRYLLGDEVDGVMNYPLRGIILDFVLRRDPGDAMLRRVTGLMEAYPPEAAFAMMNVLSTHDVARALTLFAEAPDATSISRGDQAEYVLPDERRRLGVRRMKLASFMQMTLPGAPCVYYGDEAGLDGYRDPFNRKCYPWGHEDAGLLAWYKRVIAMRNSIPALRTGAYIPVYSLKNAVAYARKKSAPGGAGEFYVAAINAGETDTFFRLDLGRFGVVSVEQAYDLDETKIAQTAITSDEGIFCFQMPPMSCALLTATDPLNGRGQSAP